MHVATHAVTDGRTACSNGKTPRLLKLVFFIYIHVCVGILLTNIYIPILMHE